MVKAMAVAWPFCHRLSKRRDARTSLLAIMRPRNVVARHPWQSRPRRFRLGQRQWAVARHHGAPMPSLGLPGAGPKRRAIKV
jgi:hypothetical protein